MSAFNSVLFLVRGLTAKFGKQKNVNDAFAVICMAVNEYASVINERFAMQLRDNMAPYLASHLPIQRMVLNESAVQLVKNSVIDDFPTRLPTLLTGNPIFIESKTEIASSGIDGILITALSLLDKSRLVPHSRDISSMLVMSVLSGPRTPDDPGGQIGTLFIDLSHGSVTKCMQDLSINFDDAIVGKMYRDAFAFFVTFALLWDAEKTPIERGKRSPINPDTQRPYKERITTRHVSLTKEYINAQRNQKPIIEPMPLDTNGMTRQTISVRGHIRNQACGPGMVERKQIFIAPHQSVRWLKDDSITVVTA